MAKPYRSLEKPIENQILNYLKLRGIFAWKNQSVGVFDRTRGIYRKSNNPHHIKGVADILGILPSGRFLAIEVKSGSGVVSEDQKLFLKTIIDNDGIAFVARSLDDVVRLFTTQSTHVGE